MLRFYLYTDFCLLQKYCGSLQQLQQTILNNKFYINQFKYRIKQEYFLNLNNFYLTLTPNEKMN
jgi:hypothetical protein